MQIDNNTAYEVEGCIVGESEKAIRFQPDFADSPEWVPKSACESIVPDLDSDDEGHATIKVFGWLINKNEKIKGWF